MNTLKAEPLTKEAFALYGDVIEIAEGAPSHPINADTTQRFHDLATAIAVGGDARVIMSMVRAQPFSPPFTLDMLERHPYGSQAFIPVVPTRFLIAVADDNRGVPSEPRVFLAAPGQGVNYFRNTWHGVLRALDSVTDFVVVDRDGDEPNLEEYHFTEPYRIEL